MKRTILKIATLILFAAAIAGAPAMSRAVDTSAPAMAGTNAPAASDQTSAAKFYGPVTAVDTNAMTFTVSDQTYTVTAETQITSAKDGKPATLAAAVVGEPARGSYVKGKNGKLDVTKVRFGKKAGGKAGGGKAGGKKNKNSGATDTGTNAPAHPSQNQ